MPYLQWALVISFFLSPTLHDSRGWWDAGSTASPGKRIHVERDEEPAEQVVRQHRVEGVDVQAQDVVQVVQVVQVLGNQVL